jgi:hypothetical protein
LHDHRFGLINQSGGSGPVSRSLSSRLSYQRQRDKANYQSDEHPFAAEN